MIDYRKAIAPLRPYVPGRPIDDVKKEYGLSEVVKIASNENPYGCSPAAKQAVIDALEGAGLYPDGNCTELREAVAQFYDVQENQIIFGCGTDEVISMIGKVFINPGDECVTAETTFSQYAASVCAMGGNMVYVPMKNYGYDLDAIAEKVTDKTRIVFITNPNNPTGTTHSNEAQLEFLKKIPSSVLVVIDEAYAEYDDESDYPDTLAHMKEYKNIMLLKTFSKAYGLASMRCGFGFAEPEIIALFEKIRNPFNVPVPAQAAAKAALADQNFIRDTFLKNKEVRDYMYTACDAMGLSYIPSQANFVMVDAKKDSGALFQELQKRGYIIRPGVAFGMPTFLRVSLGTMAEMQGFVQILKELI
jgi:histidinol-phosphate aminotransferase